MAKRENAALNPAAGLFIQKPTQDAQQVQQVQGYTQEVQENKDTLNNTQGRKGHKLPRINMAFTPVNHEFIKRTSRQLGISATEYVNNLIDEARKNK